MGDPRAVLARLPFRSSVPSPDGSHEHHHRNIQGGAARAAVFGISDGLVTNVSLILGVSGARPAAGFVRLAGLAGLISGAFSMAAGEFISMQAQRELLERELELERRELARHPEGEHRELTRIYESRGVAREKAHELATEMMRDPDVALETHAREELGINPAELGSPVLAGTSSFLAFGTGALVPLLPWFFLTRDPAIIASVILGAIAALCIGGALSVFTGRSVWRSAVRQLLISGGIAAIAYGVGAAVGVSGV